MSDAFSNIHTYLILIVLVWFIISTDAAFSVLSPFFVLNITANYKFLPPVLTPALPLSLFNVRTGQ